MTTKFPSSWITANVSKVPAEKPTEVKARIDMSAEIAGAGKCPECKKDMEVVTAGGRKVWACAADRITLPVPNGHEG